MDSSALTPAAAVAAAAIAVARVVAAVVAIVTVAVERRWVSGESACWFVRVINGGGQVMGGG